MIMIYCRMVMNGSELIIDPKILDVSGTEYSGALVAQGWTSMKNPTVLSQLNNPPTICSQWWVYGKIYSKQHRFYIDSPLISEIL